MPEWRECGRFLAAAIGLFIVLTLPIPGLRGLSRACFQQEARGIAAIVFPDMQITVANHRDPAHAGIDTQMQVIDPKLVRPDGKVPAKLIVVDSRSLGWMPQAMILALIGATPVAWPLRWTLVLANTALIQVFVAATITTTLGTAVYEAGAGNWQSEFFAYADLIMTQNLWMSFLVPALLWAGNATLFFRRISRWSGEGPRLHRPDAARSQPEKPRRNSG
jgi:hypothetical protein